MSEISTVFDVKSTKQLLSLAKSLKNDNALQNNMLKHLLVEKPKTETRAKATVNKKFTNHPSLLSSETDVSIPAMPLTNGYLKEALYHHSIKNCDSSESLRSNDSDVNCNHIQHSNLPFSPNHSQLQKSRSNVNSQVEDEFVEQDEPGCSHASNLKMHEQEFQQNLIYNKILQQKSNYFSKREYDSEHNSTCKKMPSSKIDLESREIDSEDNLFSNKMRPQTSNCIKPHKHINDSEDNLVSNKLPLQNESEDNLFLNKMLPRTKAHKNVCEDNLGLKKIYSEGYINSKTHEHDTEKNLVSNKKPEKGTLKRPSTTSINSYASVDQKLRYVLPRILGYLEDIRIFMDEDYSLPDGEEDWLRRRNCDAEFCTRFSRNYLYELGRQTNELEKLMKNPGKASFPVSGNIHSCLSRSHQTVLQALEFYLHHMPGALPNAVIDKLKSLLQHINSLCDLHTKCMNLDQTGTSRRENLIEMVKKKTDELLVKVQDAIDRFMMPTSKLSMHNMDVKKRKTRRSVLEARFSMYSISQVARTSAYWKKAVNAATRDRYSHVHSRYKTAVVKHRQPQPAEKSTTKIKLFPKHPSVVINKTPIRTVRDEDDNIQTIVGMARGREIDGLSYGGNILLPSETIQQPGNKAEQRTNKNTANITDSGVNLLLAQLYHLIHPKDMSQEGLANFTKHLMGMDLGGKINTSNQETGSEENGNNNDGIQIAHAIIQNLEHLSRETPVPKAIEYHEHEQNGVATNHHQEASEDHSVKTESKNKLTKKQAKNGEAKAIVTKKSDVNTRHSKSLDVFDIFQKYKKKCADKARIDGKGDIEIRQTSSSISKRHHTVMSVVGEKNAQLICIRDDDPLLESQDDDEITTATDHRCEDCYNKGILCENQINIIHKRSGQEVVFRPGRPNYVLKMGRLPKKIIKPISLKLPDQHVANVMKYRSNFCKYLKSDYLYQKDAKTKPWILVDRLAEFMLDDVVIAIVDEIKVNLMVDDIIHSEFL